MSNLQRAPRLDGRTLTLNQLSELWSSQLWTQFKQLRMIEACKTQDFNRAWTRDLAIPVGRSHQLSYETTDVVSWSFVGSNEPVRMNAKWYMTCFVYSTADVKSSELWSSQLCGFSLIRTHKWPTPNVSGFIAQLVRASPRYREVMGSNSVEVLTFPGFFICNCLNCVYNCEDHSSLDFTCAGLYTKHVIYLSWTTVWRDSQTVPNVWGLRHAITPPHFCYCPGFWPARVWNASC